MHKQFETDISSHFDVELMGQARWYLKIPHHPIYQLRYLPWPIPLCCFDLQPFHPITDDRHTVTPEDCETYIPLSWMTSLLQKKTKPKICLKSNNLRMNLLSSTLWGSRNADLLRLYLPLYLHFGIRKLAKFNARPCCKYYKAAMLLPAIKTARTEVVRNMKHPLIVSLKANNNDQIWLEEDKQVTGQRSGLLASLSFLRNMPLDFYCEAWSLPLAIQSSRLGAVP